MFGISPYNRKNNDVFRKPRDIFDIENFFQRFFEDSFLPNVYSSNSEIKVDIKNSDKEYVVEAELPGVNKEEISVELKNDRLTISVERKEEINEERENYIRKERRHDSLSRSFYVENIDNEKVNAKFDNGVLTIILPKNESTVVKSRKIDIN